MCAGDGLVYVAGGLEISVQCLRPHNVNGIPGKAHSTETEQCYADVEKLCHFDLHNSSMYLREGKEECSIQNSRECSI